MSDSPASKRSGTDQVFIADQHAVVPYHAGKASPALSKQDRDVLAATKAELRIQNALQAGIGEGVAGIPAAFFETALDALSLNSKIALASDLDCYVDWCLENKRTALPASAETILDYMDARSRAGAKLATIERRFASIVKAHRLLEIENDELKRQVIRDKLKVIGKRKGKRQRQAEALRHDEGSGTSEHNVSVSSLIESCSDTLTGLRDAALLSAGFDAGLRVSELTAIEVAHIEPAKDGEGTLFIPDSKTDQEGEGAFAWLSAETMQRIGRWLEEAGIAEGTVFRRVHVRRRKAREGQVRKEWVRSTSTVRTVQIEPPSPATATYTVGTNPLTRQGVVKIIRRVIETAWLDGRITVRADNIDDYLRRVSTHSLRVGLTQELIAGGQEGIAIAQALRWTSTSTVLRYGAKLRVGSGAAARVLRRSS